MTDYDWSHETSIDGFVDLTAEGWLRAAWLDGPAVLRGFLPLASKYDLGSGAGARLAHHEHRSRMRRPGASSQIMHAVNTVTVVDGRIRWAHLGRVRECRRSLDVDSGAVRASTAHSAHGAPGSATVRPLEHPDIPTKAARQVLMNVALRIVQGLDHISYLMVQYCSDHGPTISDQD